MNTTTLCFRALICVAVLAFSTVVGAKELKLGLIVPGDHAWSQAAREMGKELEQRTDGRYSVTLFPAGQLGSEAQMLQQMQTGALDMSFMTVAQVVNRVPEFGALFAPYLVENEKQADQLLKGPAAQGLLEKLPVKTGTVGLGYGVAGMRMMLNAFPSDNVGALEGRKIRITPFPPVQDFYRLLGAVSTPMPLTDVYDALANGQVDSVDADLELVWKLRLYERAKTLLLSGHMMFPVVGLVSGRTWAGMTEEDRDVLRELTRKHLGGLAAYYTAFGEKTRADIESEGVKVVEAGPDYFGDKLDQWEEIWTKKAPVLSELRKEAGQL